MKTRIVNGRLFLPTKCTVQRCKTSLMLLDVPLLESIIRLHYSRRKLRFSTYIRERDNISLMVINTATVSISNITINRKSHIVDLLQISYSRDINTITMLSRAYVCVSQAFLLLRFFVSPCIFKDKITKQTHKDGQILNAVKTYSAMKKQSVTGMSSSQTSKCTQPSFPCCIILRHGLDEGALGRHVETIARSRPAIHQ